MEKVVITAKTKEKITDSSERKRKLTCSQSQHGDFVQKNLEAKYQQYEDEEARRYSFRGCPTSQRIDDFVQSGFFCYDTDREHVRCFMCGIGLEDWEGCNAWVEHAWWSPGCRFLQDTKGRRFIEEVQRNNGVSTRIFPHTSVVIYSEDEQRRRCEILAGIEAKFKEEDVVLAYNKFVEQHGRRPGWMEFKEFINRWEGMPERKKSFDELIQQIIAYRHQTRHLENKVKDLENRLVASSQRRN